MERNDSRSKWKITLGRELQTLNRPNDESSAKSWKDSGSIGNDSSGLAGSGPKGKRIAQGYKTQGLEGMDSSWLRGSGPKKKKG